MENTVQPLGSIDRHLDAGRAESRSVDAAQDWKLTRWILVALSAGFLAYICRVNEVTHDAFHEMALVRHALLTGVFPVDDVFAYTPTVSPSVHHEWGTGAVLYFVSIETGLGVWGIAALKFVLVLALWLVLFQVARMRGADPRVFAILSLVTFPFLWVGFATIRAQLFTLVFVAVQLWMQELDNRGKRLWIVPWCLMLVAWLNIHAGFIVGLGMMFFHGLERLASVWVRKRSAAECVYAVWHLLAAAPIVLASVAINPYGWRYIPYLIHAIAMKRPTIAEWQPLWQSYDPVTTMVAFGLSLYLIVRAARQQPWARLTGLPGLSVCAWMALKHLRHGSIYAAVWIAYVPAWITPTPLGRGMAAMVTRYRRPALCICQTVTAACCLFASANQFWRPTLSGVLKNSAVCYPTGAVEYLRAHQFNGNLMTPFHAGAFVSWELFPLVKVSLDGRYEVAYQEPVYDDHRRFYDGSDGWQKILCKYPSDAILIHRQAKVLQQFEQHVRSDHSCSVHCWQLVYEDMSYAIYARPSTNLPVEDRRQYKLADRASASFSSRSYRAIAVKETPSNRDTYCDFSGRLHPQ